MNSYGLSFGTGFGGDIGIMVGFDVTNDKLLGISVTTMKETPGLGTMIAETKFTKQFPGKGLDIKLTSQGGNIDALSGATVSSTGAVQAVGKATKSYSALKAELLKAWK